MRKPVHLSRRIAITAAAVLAAGTAGALALSGLASAGPSTVRQTGSASCSVATLHGTYLFAGEGVSVSGGTTTPNAFAGAEHFDGAGHYVGNNTVSINGVIVRNRAYTGTYTVGTDCIGTFTSTPGVTFDLYTSPSGNAFTYIATVPGSVGATIEQRATRE
jgi:hypothetical protein